MRVTAEQCIVGSKLKWESPPRVAPPADAPMLFTAQSKQGVVFELPANEKAGALVRFHYKNATGGMSWSPPMEVMRGQLADIDA